MFGFILTLVGYVLLSDARLNYVCKTRQTPELKTLLLTAKFKSALKYICMISPFLSEMVFDLRAWSSYSPTKPIAAE